MKTTITLITIAVLMFAVGPTVSAQQTNTPVTPTGSQIEAKQIFLLLSSLHELPPKSEFEKVSGAAGHVLAVAKGNDSFQRDRALVALGRYWPSADSFLLLTSAAGDANRRIGTRIQCMMVLSKAFRERAVPVLAPLLKDSNAFVRKGAIRSLALGGTSEGKTVLLDYRRTGSAAEKNLIDRYLPPQLTVDF